MVVVVVELCKDIRYLMLMLTLRNGRGWQKSVNNGSNDVNESQLWWDICPLLFSCYKM